MLKTLPALAFPSAQPMRERTCAEIARARAVAVELGGQPFCKDLGIRDPIDPSVGEGYRDLIDLSSDVFVTMSNFSVSRDTVNRISGENCLKLHCQTSGHSVSRFSNGTEGLLRGPTIGLLSHPEGINEEERFLQGSREASVTISVTRELLTDKLKMDPADTPAAVRSFLDNARPEFGGAQWPLPPRLRVVLRELLRPPPLGASLFKTYLEARVHDLLWMTFSHLRSLEIPQSGSIKLSARDRDCIHEARRLLEQNLQDSLSVAELCRRVGINRNKMQYGFRTLFGMSPADYRSTVRLNLARQLLKESGEAIAIVAARAGYPHQSTFASVFKRHFGISPRQARR